MTDIPDAELAEIERRASAALAHAPLPWVDFLEGRDAFSGSSFVRLDAEGDLDLDLYVDVTGTPSATPAARLDALVEFVAHAPADVQRLVAEVRRLRGAPPA
ncbi:hypothetical protein FKR81_13310 [Lentzea tibetensis]|uniref:Uncharacterized protein n=1 Tax=Lentzea tibetensis TaxID=2591470 RepID=A0A563EVV6_9PSEU|nr:hypothetical protein [Lentzea tibetensis]TWP51826.1 hypothetical protein FKR81_13310 [Lentzea tibetensis]